MTTPAHCTRTDPHFPHDWYGRGQAGCPGVEPPADVQDRARAAAKRALSQTLADVAATPDPRLDVVADLVRESWIGNHSLGDLNASGHHARRILDALDDMRPDGRLADLVGADPNLTGGLDPGEYLRRQYAPAGLTPAQEIRLRLAEATLSDRQVSEDKVAGEIRALEPWAAWVEHGDDETPALTLLRETAEQAARFRAARDLAEARLGQVGGLLIDSEGHPVDDLSWVGAGAVRAALTLPMSMLRVADFATGPDETPDINGLAQYTEQVMRLANFIIDEVPGEPTGGDGAVDTAIRIIRETLARAGLAEARLGHIADALRDYDGGTLMAAKFNTAVRDALAWTPDDAAPADAATGDGDGWHDWVSGSTDELPRDGITR